MNLESWECPGHNGENGRCNVTQKVCFEIPKDCPLSFTQSERPKGEWILITDNNGQHFTCNRCGTWRYHQGQAFCSHCGADMRGEQDG